MSNNKKEIVCTEVHTTTSEDRLVVLVRITKTTKKDIWYLMSSSNTSALQSTVSVASMKKTLRNIYGKNNIKVEKKIPLQNIKDRLQENFLKQIALAHLKAILVPVELTPEPLFTKNLFLQSLESGNLEIASKDVVEQTHQNWGLHPKRIEGCLRRSLPDMQRGILEYAKQLARGSENKRRGEMTKKAFSGVKNIPGLPTKYIHKEYGQMQEDFFSIGDNVLSVSI